MKSLPVRWTGIRPLIMHSADMVDPLNPAVLKIKAISAKGSKKLTDADRQEIQRLEWQGALYLGASGELVVPSDCIEKCIREGATKSRLGKAVEAATFLSESEVPIEGVKYNRDLNKLFEDPQFQLRKAVRVPPKTGARVVKVRPMIPIGWQLNFNLEYDESLVNPKDLQRAMIDAGALVGLGNWRPKFGKFLVK